MQDLRNGSGMPPREFWMRLYKWRFGRRLLLFLGVAAALLAGFLVEEYWRGKRAWETCKAELLSKGAALDWDKLNPTAVPEEDDFFAAPGMSEWFGAHGSNGLPARFGLSELETTAGPLNDFVLARIEVVPENAEVSEKDADLVLRYRDSMLSLSAFGPVSPEDTDPSSAIIPVIVMEEVPLNNAIQNLARHAGLNYLLDPRTGLGGENQQPLVTIRWENVTARQALDALLANYALERVDSPQGISRIQPKDYSGPKVSVEPSARERLEGLLQSALQKAGNTVPLTGLLGSQNIGLLKEPLVPVTPLRLMVRTSERLTEKEMEQFFPATPFACFCTSQNCYRVAPWTASAYRLTLRHYPSCTAADYLAWSDRCMPDFDRIRQALQRPGANLPGLSLETCALPVRNFVASRTVAQMLSQRAQCHLLLNEPEAALRELTLLNDLRRILVCKPVTLVAAMVNVAVTGIYVEVVKNGLELNAWRKPQLTVIEAQLQEINLVPPVTAGFQLERLSVLQMLESGRLVELYRLREELSISMAQPSAGQNIRRARYHLLSLVPRGWVYQNMAAIGSLHQGFFDAVNGPAGEIHLDQIDAAYHKVEETVQHCRPGNFIAAAAFPNCVRAWHTTARNQALVRDVLAACKSREDLLAATSHADAP